MENGNNLLVPASQISCFSLLYNSKLNIFELFGQNKNSVIFFLQF